MRFPFVLMKFSYFSLHMCLWKERDGSSRSHPVPFKWEFPRSTAWPWPWPWPTSTMWLSPLFIHLPTTPQKLMPPPPGSCFTPPQDQDLSTSSLWWSLVWPTSLGPELVAEIGACTHLHIRARDVSPVIHVECSPGSLTIQPCVTHCLLSLFNLTAHPLGPLMMPMG